MKMKNTPKEWDHIHRIRQIVQRNKAETLIPLGDDAFVTQSPRNPLVMAQDMMVEGVHFQIDYASPADLGHKSLAVNLSDFAAMGATPRWAQVSLALPPNLNESWLDEFYRGMTDLADRYGVEIVGGDLCASPATLVIDVSVTGEAEHAISRKNTQVGDWLVCSGPLGLSALGLQALQNKNANPSATQKHLRPEPRLDLLPDLKKHATKIHALIDVSDGLVSECLHLSRRLEIGVELFTENILALAAQTNLAAALWGGEDYELLMTLPPEEAKNLARDWHPDWKIIGQFTDKKEISLVFNEDGVRREEVIHEFVGWQHFRPVST